MIGILWGLSLNWYLLLCLLFLLGKWLAEGRKYQSRRKREDAKGTGKWRAEKRNPNGYLFFWSALWILAFVSGSIHGGKQQEYREAYLPVLEDEMKASVCGVICKKEAKNNEYHIYLKDVILQIAGQRYRTNQVLVHLSTDEYSIGTTLLVNGTIQKFRQAVNEGGYDEEQYYHSRKVDYGLKEAEVAGCYGKKAVVGEMLYQLCIKLKESLRKNVNAKTAGTLAVMVLGEKSLLDAEVKKQYQRAGIAHILVISGLHISMLGMGLFGLLRKGRRGIGFSAAVSLLFLIGYGMMTGSSTSSVRAILMFALSMGGKCFGRTYDRATGLAFAVFVLLCQNPFLVGDSGFLFSVAAVLGVILAGEDAKTWKINARIQLMTLPLVAYYYYEVPVYALFVNLIVLPFVAPVVFFGILGSLLGLFWEEGARLLLYLPCILLHIIQKAGELPDLLPYAHPVVGQPEKWQIFGYYMLFALFLRMGGCQMKWGAVKRYLGTAAQITALWLFLTFRLPQDSRIDVLDVGQGDGICVQTKEGINFFIDGGSSDVSGVGTYRIIPYLKCNGIEKMDYWFVSHLDTDHVSGLLEALEQGYKVKHLVFSAYGIRNENWERLDGLAEKMGISILYFKEGDALQLPGGRISCIFPDAENQTEDTNGNSMILLYEEGNFQALFTGDTGSAQEQIMLSKKLTGEVDFYKAAHHGSNYSNSREWLLYLKPKISVVSCGEKNRYGHPGKEAVERMAEAGSDVYATMSGGEISLVLKGDEMELRNYRNPLEAHRYPVVE